MKRGFVLDFYYNYCFQMCEFFFENNEKYKFNVKKKIFLHFKKSQKIILIYFFFIILIKNFLSLIFFF